MVGVRKADLSIKVYGVTVVHRNTKGFNPEILREKDKHCCGSVLQCVKAPSKDSG